MRILFAVMASLLFIAQTAAADQSSSFPGFAEPRPSFQLDSRDVSFQDAAGAWLLSLSASDSAVYRYGYYSLDGSQWQRFELSGNALGGEWLNGSVSAEITLGAPDFGLSEDRQSTQRNFVVLYSCSRASGSWDCHGGWQILQFNASIAQEAKVVGVSASSYEETHEPWRSLDGNLSAESRWSAEGDGEWISYELSGEAPVDYVRFAFYYSSSRYFDVQYSEDGETWMGTNATGMTSAPDMEGVFQRFDLEPVTARYVRFVGHGSDVPNMWNSMVEADISGYAVNLTGSGCTSHDHLQCSGGDVWWYDSCGQAEDIFDDCVSGEVCSGGECLEETPDLYCGDGACSPSVDENCMTCEEDCGGCEADVLFSTGFEEADWKSRISDYFGSFSFQYSCSDTSSDNYYEITDDPEDAENSVLHFVINRGCDYSGRVQGTLVMPDRDVYHFSQRYYISEDFSMVEDTPTYMWLDLGEFWEEHEDSWDGDTAGQAQFSIFETKNQGAYVVGLSINGKKRQPASSDGEYMFIEHASRTLPLGEWFTLEWYVRRGQEDGWTYVIITEDGKDPEVLFDIHAPTVYPDHRKPVTWYQPWKFYMNVEIVNYIKGRGGTVDIYYDDFKWYGS